MDLIRAIEAIDRYAKWVVDNASDDPLAIAQFKRALFDTLKDGKIIAAADARLKAGRALPGDFDEDDDDCGAGFLP